MAETVRGGRSSRPGGGQPDDIGPPSLLARVIVALRWLIPVAWIVVAAAVWYFAPAVSQLPVAGVDALVPGDLPAREAEVRSTRTFGTDLLPRIAVVQRDPGGLSIADQKAIAQRALDLDNGKLAGFPEGSVAVPYVNTLDLFPAARERSTTAITYLAFPSVSGSVTKRNLAVEYAHGASSIAPAHTTGFIPAELAQSYAVNSRLTEVEIASVVVVAVILALYLRSLLAPIVTLVAAGLVYVLAIRAIAFFGIETGASVTQEIEPVLAVLLLGAVTDYSVFFLAGQRRRLLDEEDRREGARRTVTQVLPIVFTAAWLVALGLATLRAGSIGFVRSLGPAMAIVVLVSLAVTATFIPAVMAALGRVLFWPGLRESKGSREPFRYRVARIARRKWIAIFISVAVGLALAGMATGVFRTDLSLTPIRALNGSTGPATAARWAAQGFAPGIISPTEVAVRRPGIGSQTRQLAGLAAAMRDVPGVAAVVGPPAVPAAVGQRVSFSTDDAVRYLVVLDDESFSSDAIADLSNLQDAMPRLLAEHALGSAQVAYAGDTAISQESVSRIEHDLAVVSGAAFGVIFILLVIFLRALVAPLLLVLASALGLAATFGITTYVFQSGFGYDQLTYYVPLAVGVLLLSFGSDYNLFVVGRIWQEAERTPLRKAIAQTVPRASRAISTAGIALALSFATLALVPLSSFREFAFAMGFGVLLDTFVVRSLLIPAMMSGTGRWSWWPSKRGEPAEPVEPAAAVATDGRRPER